jgi:hypothetical protein
MNGMMNSMNGMSGFPIVSQQQPQSQPQSPQSQPQSSRPNYRKLTVCTDTENEMLLPSASGHYSRVDTAVNLIENMSQAEIQAFAATLAQQNFHVFQQLKTALNVQPVDLLNTPTVGAMESVHAAFQAAISSPKPNNATVGSSSQQFSATIVQPVDLLNTPTPVVDMSSVNFAFQAGIMSSRKPSNSNGVSSWGLPGDMFAQSMSGQSTPSGVAHMLAPSGLNSETFFSFGHDNDPRSPRFGSPGIEPGVELDSIDLSHVQLDSVPGSQAGSNSGSQAGPELTMGVNKKSDVANADGCILQQMSHFHPPTQPSALEAVFASQMSLDEWRQYKKDEAKRIIFES